MEVLKVDRGQQCQQANYFTEHTDSGFVYSTLIMLMHGCMSVRTCCVSNKEVEPLVQGNGSTIVGVEFVADVVEKMSARGELVHVVVEGDLFGVVQLDATVSVFVKVLEPLVQPVPLCLVGYCVITGRKGRGGDVN